MRFIMSNRRAGKFRESEKRASRAAIAGAVRTLSVGMAVRADNQPSDELARRTVVFDADPLEIQEKAASLGPDVLIEPEILHWPVARNPFRLLQNAPIAASPLPTGTGNALKFTVKGEGQPLAGATVHVTFRGLGTLVTEDKSVTDAHGRVSFQHSNFWTPAVAVVVPSGDFWVMVALGPATGATIDCPALPRNGPLGWWHEAVGITQFKATRGKSIKVGVVDTGCGPHPALAHVTLVGAFIDGQHLPPTDTVDVDSHGSHVCGTIGGRPAQAGEYGGIAPGVSLHAARVFAGPDTGANQGDIAEAIEALSRIHEVDLINLSLGAAQGSQIERDAIQDALERGTLCVCAAGNSNGAVEFPARFDECVAVAALGKLGWGPPASLASMRVPTGQAQRFGTMGLYHANFSCFGQGLDTCGPGVGVLASVPERDGLQAPTGVMDGTSMASPVVCATLAIALAGSTPYKSLARDGTRSAMARDLLQAKLTSIGMSNSFSGGGMPVVA